jgi:hypothetical protein
MSGNPTILYFPRGTTNEYILSQPNVNVGDMIEFEDDNQEGYDDYNHKVVLHGYGKYSGEKFIIDYKKNNNPQTHSIEPNESIDDLIVQDYVNVGDFISMNSGDAYNPYIFEVILDNTGEKTTKKVNMGGKKHHKRKRKTNKRKRKTNKRKTNKRKRKTNKRKSHKRKY